MKPRVTRPRLLRASFFLWLIVPAALLGLYQAYGLPHVLWSYSFHDNGHPYDLSVTRYYTRCTYVGPYGAFSVHSPQNGECGVLRFFKRSTSNHQGES